jgi:hypothetical protein
LLQKIQKDLTKPMEGGETASNEKTENIISQIKEVHGVKISAMNGLLQYDLICILSVFPVLKLFSFVHLFST